MIKKNQLVLTRKQLNLVDYIFGLDNNNNNTMSCPDFLIFGVKFCYGCRFMVKRFVLASFVTGVDLW